MKLIGKTVFEILNSSVLTQGIKDRLEKYFKECFETEELTDDMLSSDTQDTLGGNFYLVSTEYGLDEAQERTLPYQITESITDETILPDVAFYLDEKETTAIVAYMTGNEGGDLFIIEQPVLELFPEIREHISYAGQI